MTIQLLLIILGVMLFWLWYVNTRTEAMIPPWDLEECRMRCFDRGQDMPWDGGEPNDPWKDPANQTSSNYDVAGCMEKCNMSTWYKWGDMRNRSYYTPEVASEDDLFLSDR